MADNPAADSTPGPLTAGGWRNLDWNDPYTDLIGPLKVVRVDAESSEKYRIGLTVRKIHCNRIDICHGAILSGLADCAMGINAASIRDLDEPGPTVSLAVDFLKAVKLGEWIESRTQVLRATRSLIFCETHLVTVGGVCARANAIFSRPGSSRP